MPQTQPQNTDPDVIQGKPKQPQQPNPAMQSWMGMAPGTTPGSNPMFNPQLPQAGYHSVASPQTQQGPTNAQIWSPLVNRMAGVPHQSEGDRQTQGGNGQGLTKDSLWNGMFAQGAKDVGNYNSENPALRQSQGSNAINQWTDPIHFHGSAPSGQTAAEGAIAAGPEHQTVQYAQPPGTPGHAASAADMLQYYKGGMGKHQVTPDQPGGASNGNGFGPPSSMFSGSRAEAPPATPAPSGTQGPAHEGSPLGSPQPGFNFHASAHPLLGQASWEGEPSKTNNPMFQMRGPVPSMSMESHHVLPGAGVQSPTSQTAQEPGVQNYDAQGRPSGVTRSKPLIDLPNMFRNYKMPYFPTRS